MTRGPLFGKTIVVTRPKEQAGKLAAKIKAAGARAVLVPTIRIAPPSSYSSLDKALKILASYEVLVFTSRNAVDSFFGRARSLRLGRLKTPSELFAVGTQTAKALRRHGWKSARAPEIHRGEALARSLGEVKGKRILIPRAKAAREVLPRELRRRGAKVSVVEAYRTVPDKTGLLRLKKALKGRIDAVTFTSGSTVREFVAQAGSAACRGLFKTAAAASIGPITSAALKLYGISPAIQAKKATAESLLQGLKSYFNGGRA